MENANPSKYRFTRFSLRTVLLLVSLSAPIFFVWSNRIRKSWSEQQFVEWRKEIVETREDIAEKKEELNAFLSDTPLNMSEGKPVSYYLREIMPIGIAMKKIESSLEEDRLLLERIRNPGSTERLLYPAADVEARIDAQESQLAKSRTILKKKKSDEDKLQAAFRTFRQMRVVITSLEHHLLRTERRISYANRK